MLKTIMPQGWIRSDSNTNPITFTPDDGSDAVFQFSAMQYRPCKIPNADKELLLSLCERVTGRVRGRVVALQDSGACTFGIYGTVAVRGEQPVFMQAWVLTNAREFILATLIRSSNPNPQDMEQASQIALSTTCE